MHFVLEQQNNLESKPKEVILSVFQTGATSGDVYFWKYSCINSSLERFNSFFIWYRFSRKQFCLTTIEKSVNQKAPCAKSTWWITFERNAISILCIAPKRIWRSPLSQFINVYKNEVPPWFAVLMGSVAESITAKVRSSFQSYNLSPSKIT